MNQYVALWYGFDSVLGRTILCDDYDQAVAQCIQIAAENGVAMTTKQTEYLTDCGNCPFDDGSAVHIGGLEEPMEES